MVLEKKLDNSRVQDGLAFFYVERKGFLVVVVEVFIVFESFSNDVLAGGISQSKTWLRLKEHVCKIYLNTI